METSHHTTRGPTTPKNVDKDDSKNKKQNDSKKEEGITLENVNEADNDMFKVNKDENELSKKVVENENKLFEGENEVDENTKIFELLNELFQDKVLEAVNHKNKSAKDEAPEKASEYGIDKRNKVLKSIEENSPEVIFELVTDENATVQKKLSENVDDRHKMNEQIKNFENVDSEFKENILEILENSHKNNKGLRKKVNKPGSDIDDKDKYKMKSEGLDETQNEIVRIIKNNENKSYQDKNDEISEVNAIIKISNKNDNNTSVDATNDTSVDEDGKNETDKEPAGQNSDGDKRSDEDENDSEGNYVINKI